MTAVAAGAGIIPSSVAWLFTVFKNPLHWPARQHSKHCKSTKLPSHHKLMFLSMVIGQCLEVPSKTILKSCSWNLVWYFLMNPSIFSLQQFVLKTNNFPFPAGLAWLTISVTHKTLNIKHWTLPDWSSYLPNGQCPLNIRNQSSYLAWLIILAAQ